MNKKLSNENCEVWKDIIKEVNLNARREVLDLNETNTTLIQGKASEYLHKLSERELNEYENKPIIGFDEEIDFSIEIG